MRTTVRHQPPQQDEVMLDLSQRLDDPTLSLAWAYLAELWDNPELRPPMPNQLSHLTPPEWWIAERLLLSHLDQQHQSPLH